MEMYNILNEYADKLVGPEKMGVDGDMSLEEELEELRAQGRSQPRRFQQLYTAVPNCLFVQTQLENPCSLIVSILEDLEKAEQPKTRYVIRMFPTLVTCKPYLENMQKGIVEAIEKFLELSTEYKEKEKISYMILFKARNNHTLQKEQVVRRLTDAIRRMEKQRLEPELRNPDLVLSIDILQVVCCLSVMPGYFRYKKYNLVEIAKSKPPDSKGQTEAIGKDIPETEGAAIKEETNGKNIAEDAAKTSEQVETSERDISIPEIDAAAINEEANRKDVAGDAEKTSEQAETTGKDSVPETEGAAINEANGKNIVEDAEKTSEQAKAIGDTNVAEDKESKGQDDTSKE